MLLFAGGAAIVTGIAFGLFPALHSTRPDLASTLKNQAGQPGGAKAARRFRTTLATVQIAMSMALLVPAGLFAKSLFNVSRVDLGLKADHMVVFGIAPELNSYTTERTRQLFERMEDELGAIPGVTSVVAADRTGPRRRQLGQQPRGRRLRSRPRHQYQCVVQRHRPRLLQDHGYSADGRPRVHARRCVRRAEGRDRQPGVRKEVQSWRQRDRQAHRSRWRAGYEAGDRDRRPVAGCEIQRRQGRAAAAILPALPAGGAARLRLLLRADRDAARADARDDPGGDSQA